MTIRPLIKRGVMFFGICIGETVTVTVKCLTVSVALNYECFCLETIRVKKNVYVKRSVYCTVVEGMNDR